MLTETACVKGRSSQNSSICSALAYYFSLATAFYDNAFGFFALKVNKFIELKILRTITRALFWGVKHAGKDSFSVYNGRKVARFIDLFFFFVCFAFINKINVEPFTRNHIILPSSSIIFII